MNNEVNYKFEKEILSLEAFQAMLRSSEGIATGREFFVTVPGYFKSIALRIMASAEGINIGCPLVFCFHGSIDREKRKVPVFDGKFLRLLKIKNALVISLADPLLELHESLRTSWYAGSEQLNTPNLLRTIISSLSATINPSRVVFLATSTGAHAALVQAWHMPESVCVVSNPISRISAYYKSHVSDYRKTCWPNLAEGQWPIGFVDSVATLFEQRFDCNVIYLNNARDHHFWSQTTEFLQAVRGSAKGKLMFISSYYSDYPGHGMAPSELALWAAAACQAPSTNVEDIAHFAHELKVKSDVSTSSVGIQSVSNSSSNIQELQLNSSLSDLSIAQKIFNSVNSGDVL